MEVTTIELDSLSDNEDFNISISREDFEEICKNEFDKIIPIIEQCLKEAKLTKNKIDDIVLVGGSTRIIKIQDIIRKYFNKEPNKKLHQDETVVIGAAIESNFWNSISDKKID